MGRGIFTLLTHQTNIMMKGFYWTLIQIVLWIGMLPMMANAQSVLSKEELQQQVSTLKSQLPLSLGRSLTWKSVALSDKELMAVFELDDSFGAFQTIKQMPASQFKETVLQGLGALGSEDVGVLFRSVVAHGQNFHIVYVGPNGKGKQEVTLTPADMKQVLQAGKDPLAFLKLSVENTRKGLPIDMGSGLKMVDLRLTATAYEYDFEVDESQLDLATLEDNQASIRKNISNELALHHDATLNVLAKNIVDCGLGVTYRYIGNSSKKVMSVSFNAEEFKEIREKGGLGDADEDEEEWEEVDTLELDSMAVDGEENIAMLNGISIAGRSVSCLQMPHTSTSISSASVLAAYRKDAFRPRSLCLRPAANRWV